MREGVSFLQVGQSQPRSVRADKQLIAGGQRSGQLVRGWEATLVLKSGEWRGGRRGVQRADGSCGRRCGAFMIVVRERLLLGTSLQIINIQKFPARERGSLAPSWVSTRSPLIKSHVFALLRPLTPAPRPKDRPLILPQPYETLHVTDCRSHLCHITSLRLPIRCPKHAFHKPCPGLASASDIAPVKCICTCWRLKTSRLFLYTCPLSLSEYFEAFASLPRPCLYSSDLASTARLSVRPSSYLPFA